MKIKSVLIFSLLIFLSSLGRVKPSILQNVTDYVSDKFSQVKDDIVSLSSEFKEELDSTWNVVKSFVDKKFNSSKDDSDFYESLKRFFKTIFSRSKNDTKGGNIEESESNLKKLTEFNFFDSFDFSFFSNSDNKGEEFLSGIFEGVSAVPFEENKCYKEIQQYKLEILTTMNNVLKAFKTKENITDELFNFYSLIKKLGITSATHCNFIKLSLELGTTISTFGVFKITYRVIKNHSYLFTNILNGYETLQAENFNKAGFALGKVLQILFDYYTE
jgi:hypothetical protein